jgi:Fic family protein
MISIKQKILKHLVGNKEKTFSINEISKILKIDYKLVHTNIKKLEKENVEGCPRIHRTEKGGHIGDLYPL